MFMLTTRRILTVLEAIALLGMLFSAAPANAAGPKDGPTGVGVATEGPLANSAAPRYGQRIDWAAFQGAPSIVNGKNDFWVWNDKILNGSTIQGQNVLHIRTTTDGKSHTFTGTVTTGNLDNFYNLAVVNAGGTDSANLVGYNQFTFSIASSGNGDGVDVEWSGRWLALDLFLDGVHRPGSVLFGASARDASKMPLIVLAGRKGLLTLPLTTLDGPTGFTKNVADGYFFYRDAKGYHLRLTTTMVGDKVDYHGAIIADGGQMTNITLVRAEKDDWYHLYGGKILDFRFLTDGFVDGLNWSLTGGGMTLTLKQNGLIAAPNIALGSDPFGTVQAFTFRLAP